MPRLFRSLRHRNYRLYFFGQILSLHGTWMQNVAQAWLVYRLTESSFMLGLVSFLGMAPVLLLGLFGGLVADRLPRRRLFLGAQALAMLQALVLAGLTLTDVIRVEHVMLLATLLGFVHAFEMPARHTLVAELVPRQDLHNAIGLNSSTFNLARTLGPVTAGWLIGWLGEGGVFLLNALSYLAVIVALLVMRLTDSPPGGGSRGRGIVEGLRFAWHERALRMTLLLVGVVSLFANPYLVLMPVFAREVFGGGAEQLGLLVGAAGAGALAGALHLALRHKAAGLTRLIALAGLLLGLGLLLFSRITLFPLALTVLLLVGFSLTSVAAASNTFLQLSIPDALRGRVMALFSVIFIGFTPLGNLLAGALAERLGVQAAVLLMGAVVLLGAALFAYGCHRARVRRAS
ncbi:MFS transporter [Thiohalobacter sp. IOR34]|uniref:MFS transporter n=1 Tax=Thiohalobacter sp. IOR34 TaxID=3057176 RepID=UPI0025AFF531|nr:MFS transporter [Thiohalobacter sp. IOR34]WJW75174.1 MFS transporter [Thiohalobacter sp. IOR34]